MYDNFGLIESLNETGFEAITRAAFDSDIEEIRLIELEDRTKYVVIVEGHRR